ncbi:MAG: MerC domain-containing protein [Sphingobacteriia bacterium]|nr:MAG: MerC domain-containing protein [Sphingobacteriia bacterium]
MSTKINWDALGITASVACAIHCAILPLFLSSLPLFGVNIIENLRFEYFMIGVAFFVGVYALYHGFKKHHHSWLPLLLFSTGIVLLIAKVSFHPWRYILLVPSVLFIITAHVLNFRMCRKHNHAHSDDCNH